MTVLQETKNVYAVLKLAHLLRIDNQTRIYLKRHNERDPRCWCIWLTDISRSVSS